MNDNKLQYEPLIYILALFGLPLCCCAGMGILPAGIAYFIANNELKLKSPLFCFYFLNSVIVFIIIATQSLSCSSFITKGGAKRIMFP